jgi:hypothetical protein
MKKLRFTIFLVFLINDILVETGDFSGIQETGKKVLKRRP